MEIEPDEPLRISGTGEWLGEGNRLDVPFLERADNRIRHREVLPTAPGRSMSAPGELS